KVLQRNYNIDKAISLCRVMSRTQLECELVFRTEVDGFEMGPLAKVPEMELVTIFAVEQQIRHQAVLDHVGCSPFTRHHGVIPQVPGEIVSEVLRSAIHLPLAEHVE